VIAWLTACTGPEPSEKERSDTDSVIGGHTAFVDDHTGTLPSEHTGLASGHTAHPPPLHTGHTGHTAVCTPPVDPGPMPDDWVVPTFTTDCELVDVPSVAPGPIINAAGSYFARVEGLENQECERGFSLGDNDGDGEIEFAVACAGDPGEWGYYSIPRELWVFDHLRPGRLDVDDVSARLGTSAGGSYGELSVRVGRIGGAGRSMVVGDTAIWGDVHIVPLPVPPGNGLLEDVRSGGVLSYDYHDAKAVSLGDVDGDGQLDLVVGGIAPNLTYPYYRETRGGVSVYRGPITTLLDPVADAWSYYQTYQFDIDRPGYALAGSGRYTPPLVGDLNCDGRDDILVGGTFLEDVAPVTDVRWSSAHGGEVLFLGGTPGENTGATAVNVLYGTCYGAFGASHANVGDVTGDGLPDIATGGGDASVAPESGRGVVFVVSGASALHGYGSLAEEADAVILGEEAGDAMHQLIGPGDLNGDGVDDLVVTAWWARGRGAAYVFLGPVQGAINAADADLIIRGGELDVRFGHSLSAPGDVTGDSVPDLMVGAQASTWGGTYREGAMYVFSGADLAAAM
jgi:hypothetical protein